MKCGMPRLDFQGLRRAAIRPPVGARAARKVCGCIARVTFHLCGMPTDFSLFRDRFAEACRVRDMKPDAVYRSVVLRFSNALLTTRQMAKNTRMPLHP